MKILKELSRKEFKSRFEEKEQCLSFLASTKWSNGYKCIKCQKGNYSKGKTQHSRRCTSCGYDESPTANTLFHKVKFGIDVAFEVVYDIATSKKGANSIWLAERHGIKQVTAWLFRRKVQEAMKSSENYPLENLVHVDEFEIGTPKKGEQGRSKSESKIRIVIAVEIRGEKAGRAYAKVIDDYSCKSLTPIFETHIKNDAKIVTDKWSGYKPLMKIFPNFTQKLSDNGENFKMLHFQIRNFKNWLRGVHSYCVKEYIDQYIQEYFFRFNRLNFRGTILDKLLERMVDENPITYKSIRHFAT